MRSTCYSLVALAVTCFIWPAVPAYLSGVALAILIILSDALR